MSEHVYFVTIFLIFGTVLLVFGMKYFSATKRARSTVANEDAYRELVDKAVSFQGQSAASLAAMQAGIAEIKSRLVAVEKILKEVE
jgi:Tfp pilus assembly protein PilO